LSVIGRFFPLTFSRMTPFGREKMKKAVMGLVAAVTAGAAVIEMTVGEKSYAVELLENDAARDLMRRLPLEVTFENFGAVERIAYLKKALNLGSAPRETTPAAGDLTYYIPWGNLAVFTGPFRHSPDLVPLGKLSEEALEAVRKSGNTPVHFAVKP